MHKTRTGEAVMQEENIIRFQCSPRAELNLEDAMANTEACRKSAEFRRLPLLVDMTQISGINKQARDYHSSDESSGYFSAVALLVKSPLSRMIGNFFSGLNKPNYPMRMFNSEEQALAWLRTFL